MELIDLRPRLHDSRPPPQLFRRQNPASLRTLTIGGMRPPTKRFFNTVSRMISGSLFFDVSYIRYNMDLYLNP